MKAHTLEVSAAEARFSPARRRRLLAFLLVAPLTILLAVRLNEFVRDPLFSAYGATVIGTSVFVIYLAFGHYSDPSRGPAVDLVRPLVSCLVAVKNEEQVIERCIDSVYASSYPNFEVI